MMTDAEFEYIGEWRSADEEGYFSMSVYLCERCGVPVLRIGAHKRFHDGDA